MFNKYNNAAYRKRKTDQYKNKKKNLPSVSSKGTITTIQDILGYYVTWMTCTD